MGEFNRRSGDNNVIIVDGRLVGWHSLIASTLGVYPEETLLSFTVKGLNI